MEENQKTSIIPEEAYKVFPDNRSIVVSGSYIRHYMEADGLTYHLWLTNFCAFLERECNEHSWAIYDRNVNPKIEKGFAEWFFTRIETALKELLKTNREFIVFGFEGHGNIRVGFFNSEDF
jgi:hypothetical protein